MSGAMKCFHVGEERLCVTKRNYNESAFNGYKQTYSEYSTVMCCVCGNHWRSKAKYVASLPDAPDGWYVKAPPYDFGAKPQ